MQLYCVMGNRYATPGGNGERAGLYETLPSANLPLNTQENVTFETQGVGLSINYLRHVHFNTVMTN